MKFYSKRIKNVFVIHTNPIFRISPVQFSNLRLTLTRVAVGK